MDNPPIKFTIEEVFIKCKFSEIKMMGWFCLENPFSPIQRIPLCKVDDKEVNSYSYTHHKFFHFADSMDVVPLFIDINIKTMKKEGESLNESND